MRLPSVVLGMPRKAFSRVWAEIFRKNFLSEGLSDSEGLHIALTRGPAVVFA